MTVSAPNSAVESINIHGVVEHWDSCAIHFGSACTCGNMRNMNPVRALSHQPNTNASSALPSQGSGRLMNTLNNKPVGYWKAAGMGLLIGCSLATFFWLLIGASYLYIH